MDKLKEEIAYFMRRLYRQRLTTTSGGNISARSGDYVLITPSGIDKARLRAATRIVNLRGEMMRCTSAVDRKPAAPEIYARRPDVKAIVHAHPAAATAMPPPMFR